MTREEAVTSLVVPLIDDAISALQEARKAGAARIYANNFRSCAVVALDGAARILEVVFDEPRPSDEEDGGAA